MGNDLTIAELLKPYLPIVGAVFRGLIQIAAGFGFTWALTVTADQVTMAVLGAAMLVTLLWSAWQKIAAVKAARLAEVAAAKASAKATLAAGKTTPVTVTVTPGDAPNKAVPVSRVELAATPNAPVPAPAAPGGGTP